MGIFDRLNRVIKANLNSATTKAEDPTKMLEQTILEMDQEIRKAKVELVTQLGTAKRLEKKLEEARSEASAWDDKAVLALRSGDEQLAREALRMKQKSKQQATDLERQSGQAFTASDHLKRSIETIEQKLEDLKARKTVLASQVRQARDNQDMSSSIGGSPALSELERLTSRIDQMDAEVEASAALDDVDRSAVDAKFRDLEKKAGSSVVEDELAALKRRLESK